MSTASNSGRGDRADIIYGTTPGEWGYRHDLPESAAVVSVDGDRLRLVCLMSEFLDIEEQLSNARLIARAKDMRAFRDQGLDALASAFQAIQDRCEWLLDEQVTTYWSSVPERRRLGDVLSDAIDAAERLYAASMARDGGGGDD